MFMQGQVPGAQSSDGDKEGAGGAIQWLLLGQERGAEIGSPNIQPSSPGRPSANQTEEKEVFSIKLRHS